MFIDLKQIKITGLSNDYPKKAIQPPIDGSFFVCYGLSYTIAALMAHGLQRMAKVMGPIGSHRFLCGAWVHGVPYFRRSAIVCNEVMCFYKRWPCPIYGKLSIKSSAKYSVKYTLTTTCTRSIRKIGPWLLQPIGTHGPWATKTRQLFIADIVPPHVPRH